jgi:hypothetical protein
VTRDEIAEICAWLLAGFTGALVALAGLAELLTLAPARGYPVGCAARAELAPAHPEELYVCITGGGL